MFLFTEERLINTSDIIGIFNLEKTTVYKTSREYLSNAQEYDKIISVAESLPKSFIVTLHNNKENVYLSRFLPETLLKRKLGETL